ncbi:hypothetical protein L6Q21_02350 [Sandaracinobacter sp. RS1-74]|uniref:hypothetical protein n=1 Tax=Sandaracinobacteroides sayramensis TaxID=2913411 RepID=UPI001EDB7B50|nr:hypothetical protein [Sandaracinobacteroides sayramensis]MCG2839823.1 hypothetical protein [Sandaracinobacteroides sayramensis]
MKNSSSSGNTFRNIITFAILIGPSAAHAQKVCSNGTVVPHHVQCGTDGIPSGAQQDAAWRAAAIKEADEALARMNAERRRKAQESHEKSKAAADAFTKAFMGAIVGNNDDNDDVENEPY